MVDNWHAILDILIALGLCSVIGLERQWKQKSAGLRTHTLVGVGAALFMVVSKYGFFDVLGDGLSLDPSRVAAQVVSGIGFIGGGLIFVRRDMVRGLTTAATVWLAAAVGMAAGASLRLIALAVTIMYLVVVLVFPLLIRKLPMSKFSTSVLRVTYEDGRGLLRTIIELSTAQGYFVADFEMIRDGRRHRSARDESDDGPRTVTVLIELEGRHEPGDLAHELEALAGVFEVSIAEGSSSE